MNARIATYVLLLITVLGVVDRAAAADLNAWLDRTRIAEGETIQLTLEAQGRVSGRPDTAPLEQDFEVLGMSTGSRMSIVNGRTDARTTWTLSLSPKRSGTLVIPALRVGSHQSYALKLEVSQAPAPVAGSGADILIETDIEPRNTYVQGQVLYTIRLLHAVPVTEGRLSEPSPEHTLVQRLGEDREYATTRAGRRYQVIERRYALFPQTSEPLEVTAPVFDGEIPDASRRRTSPFGRLFGNDPFFSRDPFEDLMTPTRRVRVRGETERVDVKPRPEAVQAGQWLPAERLELKGEWQPESTEVHMGEPVTLLLDLEAHGLTAGQLPDLTPQAVDGFKVYPDQAQRQTGTTDAGVIGHLQQKIAFLPNRPGDLTLPAIEVHWWDTQSDRERQATLPGRAVKVLPVPGQPEQAVTDRVPDKVPRVATADQVAPDGETRGQEPPGRRLPVIFSSRLWPAISAVLALGWLVTLVFWWRRASARRASNAEEQPETSKSTAPAAARKQFLAACRAGDAPEAHRSLLAWAAAHWPTDPPQGLEALAQRITDSESREALAELNRALYRERGTWNGMRLATCLRQLPESDEQAGNARAILAPLYPDRTGRSMMG